MSLNKDILHYLDFPLRKDWEWKVLTTTPNITLKPNGSYELIKRTERPGWVWYGIMSFNTEYGGFELEIETIGGDILRNRYSVREIYNLGLVQPTPQGWWVPVAKSSPIPLYVVAYTPNFPGTPYHNLRFKLLNLSSTIPCTIYHCAIILLQIRGE